MLFSRRPRLNKYERAYLRKQERLTQKKEQQKIMTIPKKHLKKDSIVHKHKQAIEHVTKKIHKKTAHLSFIQKILLFVAVVGLLGASILMIWFATLNIPDVDNFSDRKISNSTKIYDKTGEIILYDIHENIRRTVVDIDNIAPSARDAIIAIEDHTFYEHNGVVWKSTLRAIGQTLLSKIGLRRGGSVGGSTLTQQVVKNTLLTRERSLTRKMKEWVLAYKIEQQLTKDQILEIYLNEAPYGGTIYGIEEASRMFFGIPARELSIAQSAYLASIPNLPTFYSPYGPNKDKLDARQKTVLMEMKRYGYISDVEYRAALEEEVEFLPQGDSYGKALHFVQYVRAELEDRYGVDMVENGGLKVVTTLDFKLQQQAEDIIKRHIEEVEGTYKASNAGLVAIEAKTGQIISMVGSRDYFDTEEFDGNYNVALAQRQPGSAFKPIAYATAFEQGYYPDTVVFDTQTQFNASCEAYNTTSANGCYAPNNYDFKFNGPLSLRNALAQSRNIPAIKVLYLAGLSNVIEQARDMGITSLTKSPNYYGLGLVLGGGEVSLLELVSAYTVFADDGLYHKPTGILKVTDIDGEVLEEYEENERRVLDSNAARMVSDVLSDNVARTPLFGSQSFLYFGERDVAGKTGTTNDNRDAWLVGYTPSIAVGVWTGNNDNSPMLKGSSISGKPWRQYMDLVLKEYDRESFGSYGLPDDYDSYPPIIRGEWRGGKTVRVDSVSGKRANEFTPKETIQEIPVIDPHTILYWINKNDPTRINTSRNDAQFDNWEYGVQQYLNQHQELFDKGSIIPDEYDDIHTEENQGEVFDFDIDNIKQTDYFFDENVQVRVNLDGIRERDIATIQYYVNNVFIGSIESQPWVFNFKPQDIQNPDAHNTLRVVITDTKGNRVVREQDFSVLIAL